jgi:hypothetical protein
MSKLFNISDEERERIKFLHETNNPHKVIVEQEMKEIGFGAYAAYQQQKTPSGYNLSGTQTVSERQTNINNNYCSVKNGVISTGVGNYSNGTKWDDYVKTYTVTADELAKAKSSCGNKSNKNNTTKSNNYANNLGDRFSKSAKSVGVENGKMDLQTLQTILKTLEGGTVAPAAGGTPDMTQLTSMLNTLNQG